MSFKKCSFYWKRDTLWYFG